MIRFDFNLENPTFAPRPAPILGTVISALGNVLTGGIGAVSQASANSANERIADKTNAQNYKMFQEQLNYNTDMWERQNAYNTPSAQMQRYKDAGINPYLAMQNGNNGNAEAVSVPSANPAVTGAPQQPLLTAETGINAFSQVLDNVGRLIDLKTRNLKNLSEIANTSSSTKLNKSVREQIGLSMEQSRALFGDTQALLGEQVANLQQQNADFAFKRNLMQIEADLMRSNIRVNDNQAALIRKNVDYFVDNLNATILNSRANYLSASSAMAAVNQSIRAFESDPQNTWFEHLSPVDKKLVRSALKSQYYNALSKEAKKLTYEGQNYDWFGSDYFRVLKSIRQTLTSIAPIMGESETVTNSAGEFLTKKRKPVF